MKQLNINDIDVEDAKHHKPNKGLWEYGIQNEGSHIRVHVCPNVKRVYVYPTECGNKAIKTGEHEKTKGFQTGYSTPTSEGYLVPPEAIERCIEIYLRNTAWENIGFLCSDNTSIKGEKAVRLVKAMLKEGLLPIPAEAMTIEDKDIQIQGTDILVKANKIYHEEIKIQVKCDYPGGRKTLGGTGHLFLQTAEANPFKLY